MLQQVEEKGKTEGETSLVGRKGSQALCLVCVGLRRTADARVETSSGQLGKRV